VVRSRTARRLVLGAVLGLVLAAVPVGTAAAASPTFRLSILHTVHGCHVWMTAKVLGPRTTITVRRGTRLELRALCPMDFDVAQTAGPRLALGAPRLLRGTTRSILFSRPGVYRLTARNVQAPAQVGLQTLGPDNVLRLTVVVRYARLVGRKFTVRSSFQAVRAASAMRSVRARS
jgi:hypothetical protein